MESEQCLKELAMKVALLRKGFLIIVAGFIANFIVFGLAFTYGVYQDFYLSESGPLFQQSPFPVFAIGSVATSLTYMLAFANIILLRYHSVRQSMTLGSILMSTGLLYASFAKKIWHFIVSQDVLYGVGSSMVCVPPVIHTPPYLTQHRGIAMGLLFWETGIGASTLTPFIRHLITNIG